ncbi:hypothetical protein MMPV_004856 [Pyropia vietnamensis]
MSAAAAPAAAPPPHPSGGGNSNPADRQPEATVHIGGLGDAPPPTEALLTELCTQVAPVKHVYLPRDRITGGHHGYAFCEFYTAEDAAYAARVLNLVRLSGRPIRVSATGGGGGGGGGPGGAGSDSPGGGGGGPGGGFGGRGRGGAMLFVGNLDAEVDEATLGDAFRCFGRVLDVTLARRPAGGSGARGTAAGGGPPPERRFGFVKMATFAGGDAAIAGLNGQFLASRPLVVQYALKKGGAPGERHGSAAERALAAAAAAAAGEEDEEVEGGPIVGGALTSIGTGLVVAFLSCWRVALVALAFTPGVAAGHVLKMRRLTKSDAEAKRAYQGAGAVLSKVVVDNIWTVTMLGVQREFLWCFEDIPPPPPPSLARSPPPPPQLAPAAPPEPSPLRSCTVEGGEAPPPQPGAPPCAAAAAATAVLPALWRSARGGGGDQDGLPSRRVEPSAEVGGHVWWGKVRRGGDLGGRAHVDGAECFSSATWCIN